jgi:hypothetical protein
MRNADWSGSRIVPGAPIDMPTKLPEQIEAAIVAAKREKPIGAPARSGSASLDDCRVK